MKYTANYGMKKPESLIDNVSPDPLNDNVDIIDAGLTIYLGVTSGSTNAYTVVSDNIVSLNAGLGICVKFHAASTAASTLNVNGLGAKAIKKPGGVDVTNLKEGLYTLRYDGTNFILQGEGASGDATASNLLSGKTATTDAGEITGTMLNRSGATTPTSDWAGSYGNILVRPPQGYYDGVSGSTVSISDPDFAPSNFLANKNIFGLQGGIPLRGDEEHLHWRRAIADEANNTEANSTERVHLRVPLGAYLSELSNGEAGIFCDDPDYIARNILSTANIFGKQGSVPVLYTNNGVDRRLAEQIYSEPTVIFYKITPDAYYAGVNWILAIDYDFVPANILNTANIFGIQGTAIAGKRFASGTTMSEASTTIFVGPANSVAMFKVVVSGLSFKPSIIVMQYTDVYAGVTQERLTVYRASGGITTNEITTAYIQSNDMGAVVRTLFADAAPAYVVNGGFCLPSHASNAAIQWQAWE